MSMVEEIRAGLAQRGVAWPEAIEHFERIASTSDYLKRRAREGAGGWCAALADEQTAGRGRQGRSWLSRRGDLFLSLLLPCTLPAARVVLLPLLAGIAVAEALEELGVDARLKWPNDVLSGGRKLAGVLAEASSSDAGLETLVLGIGVNLALDPADAPAGLSGTLTSVRELTGTAPAPARAASAVMARVRLWYDAFAHDSGPDVIASWMARSVPWWGAMLVARSGNRTIRGLARGLDARGALLLEQPDGSRLAVVSGEVREVRDRYP